MKTSCMLGRHWPLAAYGMWQEGFQLSRCADCGHPMLKASGTTWLAMPSKLVKRARSARRQADSVGLTG